MTAWLDPRKAIARHVQLDLPLPTPRAVEVMSKSVQDERRLRGKTAYLSGLAAEDTVERLYVARGLTVVARRWRGSCAEIDLVLRDGAAMIFVEVKKSRSFDVALLSLGRAQRVRIMLAASEFLDRISMNQLTDMRFDLAMVNDIGVVEILENAFGEDD